MPRHLWNRHSPYQRVRVQVGEIPQKFRLTSTVAPTSPQAQSTTPQVTEKPTPEENVAKNIEDSSEAAVALPIFTLLLLSLMLM